MNQPNRYKPQIPSNLGNNYQHNEYDTGCCYINLQIKKYFFNQSYQTNQVIFL